MPKQAATPWLDLALDVIEYGVRALEKSNKAATAAARSQGFENAEHEVLVFLSSSWCYTLMDTILGQQHDRFALQGLSPDNLIQEVLDCVYGRERVAIVDRAHPTEYVRRTERRRRVTRPVNISNPNILDRYEDLILAERAACPATVAEIVQGQEVREIVIEIHHGDD